MRNLNLHNLRRELDKLCLYLNKKYSINCGGCCFLASIIALNLDRLHIKYRLVIFSRYKKNIYKIEQEIRSKVRNGVSYNSVIKNGTCSHYTIYLEGGGAINIDGYNFFSCKYFIKDINASNIKWIYKLGSWNPEYNIIYNTEIRNIVNKFFISMVNHTFNYQFYKNNI